MTKRIVFMLFATAMTVFSATVRAIDFAQYFHDRTLRIDYLRTGTAKSNTITVKDFVAKSGGWAGSFVHTIDPFDYGAFRVVVK
ncbi:MAG: hypothetical protein J6Z26_06540, partial [Bacteroidales bacterium]|nr:hypothetical protein [Bacteroidales bacterium]